MRPIGLFVAAQFEARPVSATASPTGPLSIAIDQAVVWLVAAPKALSLLESSTLVRRRRTPRHRGRDEAVVEDLGQASGGKLLCLWLSIAPLLVIKTSRLGEN